MLEELEKHLNIGQHLEIEQKAELKALLAEFSDVFSDKPGRTDLMFAKYKFETRNHARNHRTGYLIH